jgi:hypothetical protein
LSTFYGGVIGFVYPVSGIKTTVGVSTAAGSATGVGVRTGLGPGGPGGEREGIGKGETIVGVGGGDFASSVESRRSDGTTASIRQTAIIATSSGNKGVLVIFFTDSSPAGLI